MFFAFLSVTAVFLDAPQLMDPQLFAWTMTTAVVVVSAMMVSPITYPKLVAFRGASPLVILSLACMPFLGTRILAAAVLVGGLLSPSSRRCWWPVRQLESSAIVARTGTENAFSPDDPRVASTRCAIADAERPFFRRSSSGVPDSRKQSFTPMRRTTGDGSRPASPAPRSPIRR